MNCESYQAMTPREKKELMAQLAHVVQSDEVSLLEAKKIIERGRKMGLLDDVQFMPTGSFAELTIDEMNLLQKMKKIKGSSVWEIAIQKTCTEGNSESFRTLLIQLRDQSLDAPESMKRIIGEEIFEQVLILTGYLKGNAIADR